MLALTDIAWYRLTSKKGEKQRYDRLILLNFSEVEYCALPQLRFTFQVQVKETEHRKTITLVHSCFVLKSMRKINRGFNNPFLTGVP